MNGARAIEVLLDVANKLHCRCAILIGQQVSAEITSRMRKNEERARWLADKIGITRKITRKDPTVIYLGRWDGARWEPWPRALAAKTLARLVFAGALEGREARETWSAYMIRYAPKVARRSP